LEAVANTAIASSVTARSGDPNENTIKEFVSLALHVPWENIGIRKIKTKNPGCVALVSVHGELLYMFKAGTTRNEIKISKKFLSFTDVPEAIDLVVLTYFASQMDLEWNGVHAIASTSDQQIKGLDPRTQYYSIQIALKCIDISFPVSEEAAREFNDTQWWYYLFKFSHRFTDEEILRCQRLGMPDAVVLGIEKLKQTSWPKEVQDEYRSEIEGVDANYKALAAERTEGRSEGEKAGQLRGLITAFLKSGQLDEEDVENVSERFSRDFVRNIWSMHKNRRKTEDLYTPFIAALDTYGLLIE
jgi:hypothetical protein